MVSRKFIVINIRTPFLEKIFLEFYRYTYPPFWTKKTPHIGGDTGGV